MQGHETKMQYSNKRRRLANRGKSKRKNRKLRRKERKMAKSTQRVKKKNHKRRSVLLEKSTRTNQEGNEKTGLITIDKGKTGQERTDQEEMVVKIAKEEKAKTVQEEMVKEVEDLDEAHSGATKFQLETLLPVGKGFLEETTQDLTTETEIPTSGEEQGERKDLKHCLQEREVSQNEESHPRRMTNRLRNRGTKTYMLHWGKKSNLLRFQNEPTNQRSKLGNPSMDKIPFAGLVLM